MEKFPCHTQSVEQLGKEVSAASAQVFRAERRDGCVHARCSTRKLVLKVEKKDHFNQVPGDQPILSDYTTMLWPNGDA